MKILYLDICCLNHPYDDFSQIRVLLESEAVLEIMRLCEENNWIFPSSEIIDLELSKITNNEKLLKIIHLYEKTNDHLTITDKTIELSRLYRTQGIGFYDSMHLALAEENGYHYLFTTDDDFIKLSKTIIIKYKSNKSN